MYQTQKADNVNTLIYNEEIDKQVAEVRTKKNYTVLRYIILAGKNREVK